MSAVGFVRNSAARQLRGAPSTVAGCVVLDASNPFFAEVVRGVEDRLAEADVLLVTCSTDVKATREQHYLRLLEEQQVRGILVNPVIERLEGLLALSQRGTPVVLLDHPSGPADLCSVSVDNARGGMLAMEHLLTLGHRRVALLTVTIDVESLVDRVAGAERAIRAASVNPSEVLSTIKLPSPAGADRFADAVERILDLSPRPTAIMCFNDNAAVSVLRELRGRGMAVPGDMSVVGYDDVHFASELSPALTTVRQPRYQLGRAAAGLLLEEAQVGHHHQDILFQPELIVRQSTAPPPRPSRQTAAARPAPTPRPRARR